MTGQNIKDIYALTPLQLGILFHAIDSAVPGAYFNQVSSLLEQDIDTAVLQRAWQELITRHDVTRTLFTWEKRDKPLQIVRHHAELPWQELDWTTLTSAAQDKQLLEFLSADRKRGFELQEAPLMRVTLIKLCALRWRMIWSFHHLILDGWSVRLLLSEVQKLYGALLHERDAGLLPAPDFRRFVDWHYARDTSAERSYWQDLLGDYATPVFPKVTDRDPVADQLTSQMVETGVDARLYADLKTLAKQQHVTLNTVFVAAWSVVLAIYGDTDDVVFGTTAAGRAVPLGDIAQTAGLFINTLPMRVRFDPNDTVSKVLQTVQSSQVRQREFEQSSLVSVQRCSGVPMGTPLFETILVYENFPTLDNAGEPPVAPELQIRDQQFYEYSNYPLALLVVPEKQLKLIAVHNLQRLSENAVRRLLDHYQTVLQQMVSQPQQTVSTIALLTKAEHEQVVSTWNATDVALDDRQTVVSLFEHQVAEHPDAIAITAGKTTIGYAQLNRRANQLAHELTGLDAASRGVVIYSERNADALISVIAALKAGAPYALVDAKDAGQRLSIVLEDFDGAFGRDGHGLNPVVMTSATLQAQIPVAVATPLIVDSETDSPETDNLRRELNTTGVAYVIYTSGSTGRPKGVMVSHRNLYNSTTARFAYYDEPVRSFALLSSLATDSAIAGIFWTLCSGGNLVIPANRAELEIEQLAQLIQTHQVSHVLCVPSLYALILEHARTSHLASLKAVIVAGEACPTSLILQHFATLGSARLFNEYGPSEACVWATVCELQAGDANAGVTIGRPIQNTRVFITDRQQRPVPIGVAGELCISGANVAMGYLGDDALTSQSFVWNPSALPSEQRLYCTGDRARYLPDGRIEFLGRQDQQLKVRGYRVEPGEIEAVLSTHPDVREAVVLIDDSAALDTQLDNILSSMSEQMIDNLIDSVAAAGEDDVKSALLSISR